MAVLLIPVLIEKLSRMSDQLKNFIGTVKLLQKYFIFMDYFYCAHFAMIHSQNYSRFLPGFKDDQCDYDQRLFQIMILGVAEKIKH